MSALPELESLTAKSLRITNTQKQQQSKSTTATEKLYSLERK